MSDQGQGLQVVRILDDHSYQLDEELLEQVLLKKEIRDLPVVVVSVAGAARGGKSFLLNFFLRFLSSQESSQQNGSWLGEDSAPLLGFSWRGGANRNTTGILLWSEPFIITLASRVKVGVLLMDTQGTFDNRSTVRDNSTIFALSTLISSIQIYNLSTIIQEDHLQHLMLFTMYGKMVQEKDNGGKAFQTLGFLVRDWRFAGSYPFGAEGGNKLLHELLKITPNQPRELQDVRNHLRSSFEELFCFLMPHPGQVVSVNEHYEGNIAEIEMNFRKHLKELVSLIFSSEKLCPKTINGHRVTSRDLCNYFKAYVTLFNSDQMPNPKSIVQATIEASLLSALNEAREIYDKGMEAECGPTQPRVPLDDLLDLHRKYLESARETFTNKKTMASQFEVITYLDKLTKDIETRLPLFKQSNLLKLQAMLQEANDAYEKTINNVIKNQQLCLHPLDLEEVHKEAVLVAIKVYDTQVKIISNFKDDKKTEFIQCLQNRYVQLMMTNDKHNKDVVKDLLVEYRYTMNNKSMYPPISNVEFSNAHDAAFKEAVNKFQGRRNRPSTYSNDAFKDELEKTIADIFYQLQEINQSKIEQEKMRLEQNKIKEEAEQARAEHQMVLREQETMRLNQERERNEQERERLKIEGQRIEQISKEIDRSRRNGITEFAFGLVSSVANFALNFKLNK